MLKYLSFWFILCAVIEIKCWSGDDANGYRSSDYTRHKRAKYSYSLSHKNFGRPSYSYGNRNPFAYSTSHGYTSNDLGLALNPRPYKVSKTPFNEGLGDDDFSVLINYLSHKDLDKIADIAAEKAIYTDIYRDSDNYDNNVVKTFNYEEDRPNSKQSQFDHSMYKKMEYRPSTNYQQLLTSMYAQTPVNTGDDENDEISLLDKHFQNEMNTMSNSNNIFTDSSTMKEEELPKPINLREDYYDASHTDNVPSVVKPETAYRLESFADLPLMNYEHSKLYTVNSYSVPHYSVISSSNRPRLSSPVPQPPSQLSSSILALINAPEVEAAPPVSAAKEQSDAHLKAIKIWTHKSTGTAYTLHDDGTLSLEQPSRPRYKFP